MNVELLYPDKDLEISDEDGNIFKDFITYCVKKLQIKSDVKIKLLEKNHTKEGISTGGYDTETKTIYSRLGGRCMLDAMRTISHELVHLTQDDHGQIPDPDKVPNIGGKIEDEANIASEKLVYFFVKNKGLESLYNR